jgi:homoserine O-acetyltransferase/O-succinyltransferase
MKTFHSRAAFPLDKGSSLPEIVVAYHTYGTLNESGTNVIWICHALTANSNPAEWWPGMIGPGAAFDSDKYFIVCANTLGSCYGSTGPLSVNAATGKPYFNSFPLITCRDIVRAQQLLSDHLGIKKIYLLAGGSMGGYQVLEWAALQPDFIEKIFVIASSAAESAWGIAIHTAQRLAIEADETWGSASEDAGKKGLKAARAFGMVSYRSYESYVEKQSDTDLSKLDNFKASGYINYQGQKLVDRFNAYSYWYLTKAMDNHNVARGRAESPEAVLARFPQQTLIIGIRSDLLCPLPEQRFLAEYIPAAQLVEIDSLYGHDGFLVETEQISKHIKEWSNK